MVGAPGKNKNSLGGHNVLCTLKMLHKKSEPMPGKKGTPCDHSQYLIQSVYVEGRFAEGRIVDDSLIWKLCDFGNMFCIILVISSDNLISCSQRIPKK